MAILKVVQVFLKGEEYEIACPNNEDEWYEYDFLETKPELKAMLEKNFPEAVELAKCGEIDYIACRGDW